MFRAQASQQLSETERLKNQAHSSSPFVMIAHKMGAIPLPDSEETHSNFYSYLSPKLPIFKNLFHSATGDFSLSPVNMRKQKINHAYTLGYMDLPFLVIASGLKESCDPDRMKCICHDEIPYLLQQFRRKLERCETRFELKRQAAQLIEQINQLADTNNKFTLGIAVTYVALGGRKKVLSFGVGNEMILKKSAIGNISVLKSGHAQEKKYLSGAKLDFRSMQFTSDDIRAGDQVFAVTEEVSHLLGKSDLLKIVQESEQKEIVNVMEACSAQYSRQLQQSMESKSNHEMGGSCSVLGFVVPAASEINQINRHAFARIANFDLFKEIIFDNDYWKTKSHFSLQAPQLIRLMQRVNCPYADGEFFEWCGIARERQSFQNFFDKYIYDRRDPMTKALMRVLVDTARLDDLAQNGDFYMIYTDWMRFHGGRSKVVDFSSRRKMTCEVYVNLLTDGQGASQAQQNGKSGTYDAL